MNDGEHEESSHLAEWVLTKCAYRQLSELRNIWREREKPKMKADLIFL